jgi:glutamate transport system permease protein
MSGGNTVITEELGPRGLRRVRIGTAVALFFAALAVIWIYLKLDENGQLESEKWTDLLFTWKNVEFLLEGLYATVRAALVAAIIATVLGFALALMRLAKSKVVEVVAIAWVELFRALPLLLVILAVFALDTAYARTAGDRLLGTFWSVVVALVLYNSAVLSEIFRAGVKSLDSGQFEAAQAVGMSYWQMMFLVVLPQAVRRMIPALVAQMATLTKDVSLGFVIGYEEFVRRGSNTPNFSEASNLSAYVVVGVVYFILVWALARLARVLEERQKKSVRVDGAADAELEEPDPTLGGVGIGATGP